MLLFSRALSRVLLGAALFGANASARSGAALLGVALLRRHFVYMSLIVESCGPQTSLSLPAEKCEALSEFLCCATPVAVCTWCGARAAARLGLQAACYLPQHLCCCDGRACGAAAAAVMASSAPLVSRSRDETEANELAARLTDERASPVLNPRA